MDLKKFILGSLVGGITMFLLGFVVYAIILEDFYTAQTVSGIAKSPEQMKYYPLFFGNVATASLLSYIFLKWANITTFAEGMKAGAVIGFFMAAGFDLVMYDTSRIMSAVGVVADIFVFAFLVSIVGGVVGVVLGMGKKTA
jgi:hypothetical protein